MPPNACPLWIARRNGDPSCKREQVAYLPGFSGRANRTADAWFYLCSTTGNYPSHPDSRNHPKVPFASEEQSAAWSSSGRAALASDHNPHTLLGNSSVARTVARFAPPSVKFLLLTCHPAKRALSTYRFRYFGKGEFAFRQQALKDLEAQGMDFGIANLHRAHRTSACARKHTARTAVLRYHAVCYGSVCHALAVYLTCGHDVLMQASWWSSSCRTSYVLAPTHPPARERTVSASRTMPLAARCCPLLSCACVVQHSPAGIVCRIFLLGSPACGCKTVLHLLEARCDSAALPVRAASGAKRRQRAVVIRRP
eukprot:COSAG06_NODE_8753_length_2079_cov_1.176263_2_plen_311_part_00